MLFSFLGWNSQKGDESEATDGFWYHMVEGKPRGVARSSRILSGEEGDEGIWHEDHDEHDEHDEHRGEIVDTNSRHTRSGYSRGPESPTQT